MRLVSPANAIPEIHEKNSQICVEVGITIVFGTVLEPVLHAKVKFMEGTTGGEG